MLVLVLQGGSFHASTYGLMSRHSSVDLPFPCLFLALKCLFFIMIYVKCVKREIMINLHELGMKFALKAHNERIRHAQILCNFTSKHPQT